MVTGLQYMDGKLTRNKKIQIFCDPCFHITAKLKSVKLYTVDKVAATILTTYNPTNIVKQI